MSRRFYLLFLAECFVLTVLIVLNARPKETKEAREVSAATARENPRVALTFDDGPSKYTTSLLDGLRNDCISFSFTASGDHLSQLKLSNILFCYSHLSHLLVYCLVHFQQNDAEWIFSLQGGGMRRSGGYVD